MRRIFHPDEKVTLECKDQRVAAEVTLCAPNQIAICFTVDEYISIPSIDGGMVVTKSIPVFQHEDGSLTDLFNNEWRIV